MSAGSAAIARHADALRRAELEVAPIAPLSADEPALSLADAYAIQRRNVDARVAEGAVLRGRKAGLTSKPMQQMLGVDEPDFGALLDDMFVEDGDAVDLATLIAPQVEAEIAFLLDDDLAGPGVTAATALPSVAGVLPALEIIDSRIRDWKIGLIDTIADNASSGRLVVGPRLTSLKDLDLRLLGMAVSRNHELVDTGAGAAALGHPLHVVAWLANKLSEFGTMLRAGDIILAGSLHRAFPVAPADVVSAEFAGLGPVTARFERIA